MRKRTNKNYSFVPSLTDAELKIPKKIAKKLKKLKNMVVASFQAKIGCKRLKKIENKNYRSVLFPPDA